MTFEEAIEIIEKVDGEVGAFRYIINKLQETYAPKIKMTKLVYDWYKETLDNSDDFEAVLTARWEMPNSWEKGYSDAAYQIRSLDDKTLALAWLHPELIEVVE